MFFKKKESPDQQEQLKLTFSESVQTALEFTYALKYGKLPNNFEVPETISHAWFMSAPVSSVSGENPREQDGYSERYLAIGFKGASGFLLYLRKPKDRHAKWRILSLEYGDRVNGGYYLVLEPHERSGEIQVSREIHQTY